MARNWTRRRLGLLTAAPLLPLAAPRIARAAGFPEPGRPITLILPYAPGGGTDIGARLLAAGMAPFLKTSVQVVNRPGAGSQVGLTQLVRSKPDGYAVAFLVVPTVTTHYLDPTRHAIYTRESFMPIGRQYVSPSLLAVKSDARWKTLKDLVEDARKRPGQITVSDSGLLGTPNLCTLLLGHVAGVSFTPVHFDGGPPSVTALLGSQVDVLAGGTIDALPYMKSGQFRVLGLAADDPDWSMPEVPTMKSLGYDVNAVSNTGMVAPTGTPPEVIAVLSAAMKASCAIPDQQERLRAVGNTPGYLDGAGYEKVWIEAEDRVRPVIMALRKGT